MIRFEYECAGEGCGFASDDMQEALDHIDAASTLCTSVTCIAVADASQIASVLPGGRAMTIQEEDDRRLRDAYNEGLECGRRRAAKREKTNNEHLFKMGAASDKFRK